VTRATNRTRTPPTRTPRTRALIIGIDGGTYDVIDPLVTAGRLPHLASLLRRGISAPTATTWPAHTAPGWTSLLTACQPGGHGIFQFFDTQDPAYRATVRQSTDAGRSTVWSWLAAQGHTLGLINIPMSHPPADLPGYQITWPLIHTLRYCRPPELLGELHRQGAHVQPDLATMFRGDMDYVEEAHGHVAARTRAAVTLMRERPADVVMVVYTEIDRVCHHYWQYGDPDHPRYVNGDAPAGWRDAITRIHEAVDAAIGQLLAEVDEDTVVVVVSDHGSGAGRFEMCVNGLLEAAGLLSTRPRSAANGTSQASWFGEDDREVDFTRTAAYTPVPGSFGINVNLAGRQRDGVVGPADHERVLAEVSALLSNVDLPDGGGRAFRAVLPRQAAYPGPYLRAAPDLLLIPRDEGIVINAGLGDGSGWRASGQSGLHRYAGMWLQASPRVQAGRVASAVSLVDIMPTLLTELGVGWPATVHGAPVLSAFHDDVRVPAPVESDDPTSPALSAGSAGELADAVPNPAGEQSEDAYTANALRAMGYM
jgi:predicted AlkP superfamily phosphohydrolase/phosphomutase